MNATDPRCAMLFEMTQSAHRLGLAFAAQAERADEAGRRIEYFKLFDRCFFAVRVGIALELRLRREARVDAARASREVWGDPSDLAERDPSENEGAERAEPEGAEPERPEQDRDRDREVERATLPQLLNTLQSVAADAAALPAPPPAELPTLQDLLARFSSDGAPAPRSDGGQPLRARLAGSAAGQTLTLSPPAPHNVRDGPHLRSATGPPKSSPRAKPD